MNKKQVKQILKIKESLTVLDKYSFDNYSILSVLLIQLKTLIEDPQLHLEKQTVLDTTFELDDEFEQLSSMRRIGERDLRFGQHVASLFFIINIVITQISNSHNKNTDLLEKVRCVD